MKDPSARDKAIENLVSEKLRARTTAGNGCPDEEIIAAYFERSLAAKERVRWEAHFDTCAECQHRIAALVRMDEAGEASISKPVAKFAPQPAKSPVLPAGGRTFGRWAWAAPVLLVVLVAGLWYTGEFDNVMNRHAEPGQRAAVPSANQTQPKPATTQAPEALTENRVAGAKGGAANTPQPSVIAKDKVKAPQNAPATSAVVGQPARAPAPPPPPPRKDLENERRDRKLETASATPSPEGSPGQVQSLPVTGRNAARLSADELKLGTSADQGQGAGSAAAMGAPNLRDGGLAGAALKNEPGPATAKGAAGEVQAKSDNVPAPAPPPPTTSAEVHTLGAFSTATESSARALKKAAALPAAPAASVKGIVKDPSGAVIPGATVILMNTQSKLASVFKADLDGSYLASVIPGDYTIEANAPGFTTSVVKDVKLLARADRQLDFSLQVGQVAQMVTVEAAAPILQVAPSQWRVGPRGLIQKRIGQDEWETKTSGVAVDLYDISFFSNEFGWAVGQVGTVLRSANGGESWGRVTSPTGENLIRVRSLNAESAEVTTRSGVVYKTTDGAATWTRVESAH